MVERKFNNNSAQPEKKNGVRSGGGGVTKTLKKGIKKVGSYNTLLKASQRDDDSSSDNDNKKVLDSPKSADVTARLNASFGDECWSVGAYDDNDNNNMNDSLNDISFLMSPEGTDKHQIIGGPPSQVTNNGSHKSFVSLLDEPENEEGSRIPPPPPPPQDYPASPHSISSKKISKKKKNKKKLKDDLGVSSHHNSATDSEISINTDTTTTKVEKKKRKIKKQNSKRNLLLSEGTTDSENVDDDDNASTKGKKKINKKQNSKRNLLLSEGTDSENVVDDDNASAKGKKNIKKQNSKRNLLISNANEDEHGGNGEGTDTPTKPKKKKSVKRQSSKRNLRAGEDTEVSQDSFASLKDGIATESAAAGKSPTKKKDKKPKKQKSKSKDDINSSGHSTFSKNSASSVNEDFLSVYDEIAKKLENQYDDMVQNLGYDGVKTEQQEGQSKVFDPTSQLGLTVQSKAADTVAVAAVAGIQATQEEEPQRQQPSEQQRRRRKKGGEVKRRVSTGMLFNPADDEDHSNDMGDPLAYISKDDTCGILEDSNLTNRKVSYLLGDVETLEKDLAKERATLQKIRETAAFERESLEIQLQLESDENERLRERVRELECKASEKHFTSVANEEDVIRTVRSENEALKEQIRKLQEEAKHARERNGLSDSSFRSDDSGTGALSSASVHSQPFKDGDDAPLFCEDRNTSARSSTNGTASFRFQQGGLLPATAKIKDHEATIEKQARDLSEMEKQIRMYRTGSQVNEAIFQLKRAEDLRAEMEVKNKKLESTISDQNQLIQMLMTQVADAKRQYELQLPKNHATGGGGRRIFRRSNSLRGLFDASETDNDTVDTSSRTSSGFGLSNSRIRKSSSAAGLFNTQ